jgi:cytochrome c-type biogenesis protein CcmH
MKHLLALVVLLAVTLVGGSLAQSTLSPDLEARARALGLELKCPVCQGSAIAESPSEFARSMMTELRWQVGAGRSDAEITQYFVTRYGEDVRLKPSSPLVWVLPGAVVLLGAFGLVSYLRRASQPRTLEASAASLERVRQDLGRQDSGRQDLGRQDSGRREVEP